MAKQTINVGTTANDKKGDSLRAAFQKVNANFTELYTALGLNSDGTLNLGAFEFSGSTMSTTDSTPIVIDQSVTVNSDLTIGGDILPNRNLGSNLGSPSQKFHSLYVGTGSVYIGDAVLSLEAGRLQSSVGCAVDSISLNGVELTVNESGQVQSTTGFVGASADTGDLRFDQNNIYHNTGQGVIISNFSFIDEAETAYVQIPAGNSNSDLSIVQEQGNVRISANTATWTFNSNGNLNLPTSGSVLHRGSYTRTSVPNAFEVATVVWTSVDQWIASAKLNIQVEANEAQDETGFHTQSCELILAARANMGEPDITVYAVTHTSANLLVTFTVQRNVSGFIEIIATPAATMTGTAFMRIYSVEMISRLD